MEQDRQPATTVEVSRVVNRVGTGGSGGSWGPRFGGGLKWEGRGAHRAGTNHELNFVSFSQQMSKSNHCYNPSRINARIHAHTAIDCLCKVQSSITNTRSGGQIFNFEKNKKV